jgi:uncharacterized membrane protein (Fun14 family)
MFFIGAIIGLILGLAIRKPRKIPKNTTNWVIIKGDKE